MPLPIHSPGRAGSPANCVLRALLIHARRDISDILFAVRIAFLLRVLLLAAGIFMLSALPAAPARPSSQEAPPPASPPSQPTPPSQPDLPSQQAPPAPAGPIIVLDPAHGGTDSGARGENGIVEKDLVLQIARTVRGELERQGYHVAMTRDDDSNPSYDDRAAVANARRDAIFISLHIASTGTAGTARAYYDQFWSRIPSPVPPAADAHVKKANPPVNTLISWQEAQRPYAEASHRLADLLQAQCAQLLSGSAVTSTGAAVRELRSVAAPAVALEISSVSVSTPDSLKAAAAPLSTAIARSIPAFRSTNPAGTK
jgi:N-acetylmuramoyl-L-alanine amidase